MKLDKCGKFWAITGAIFFWSGYLLLIDFNTDITRDILLFIAMLFAGIRWFSEDE